MLFFKSRELKKKLKGKIEEQRYRCKERNFNQMENVHHNLIQLKVHNREKNILLKRREEKRNKFQKMNFESLKVKESET